MLIVALGEIVVVVVIRPLRWLLGGLRTPFGRGLLRLENWLLNQLHIMGAESKMRYELEMHGESSAFLAESLSNPHNTMPSASETLERARRETGADELNDMQRQQSASAPSMRRGPRQVESSGGDRSDDIQREMLEAQRRQNQQADRAHRRRRR